MSLWEKPRAISAARSICARSWGARTARRPRSISAAERRIGDFVRGRIEAGELTACHDLSDGGLLVALAEMAMAGRIGAEITLPRDIPAHGFCFGEDQARYLATLPATALDGFLAAARKAGVPALALGRTGGNALTLRAVIRYR